MTIESKRMTDGFSEPKKKILSSIFKVMQKAGLEELTKAMDISRMAVHKHLTLLQKRGLVKAETRTGVGRPKMMYQLTGQSKTVFPKSYGAIASYALDFIEKNMGKEAVEKVLRERQDEPLPVILRTFEEF